MTRFAFLSPPYTGHLNPMLALAKGLRACGHTAIFVAQVDVTRRIARPDIGVRAVGAATHPPGSLDQMEGRLAGTTGIFGIGGVIRDVARTTEMLCREGTDAIRDIGADVIVCDQTEPAGGLLARRLGLPQVSVANALLINRDALVPPPFVDWRYDASDWGVKRNRGGDRIADLMMWPVNRVIRRYAADWALGRLRSIEDCLSPVLQISQTLRNFDFPRAAAPAGLVHVGPLREAEDRSFTPPDGRPLVFCSLGTLQGSRFGIFQTVAETCAAMNFSLVIAHGGKLTPAQITRLPGRPIVEAFLPQRAVMAKAALVITHGGLNTVLDGLSAGVPLVVMPIAFEQGAIAARVEHAGAGKAVALRRLTRRRLEAAVTDVLTIPEFRQNAGRLRQESVEAGGVEHAVRLIEALGR